MEEAGKMSLVSPLEFSFDVLKKKGDKYAAALEDVRTSTEV
jgi:hypothetical protein